MLLSAQSFADLKGKGLLCVINQPYDEFWAYEFKKSMKYKAWTLERTGDKIELISSKDKIYDMNADNIYVDVAELPVRVSRKTLQVLQGTDYKKGMCIATENYKEAIERLKKIRDNLQRDYDTELEGNKI